MQINKESLIIYHRKILENKENSELIREHARRKLLKLFDKNESRKNGK